MSMETDHRAEDVKTMKHELRSYSKSCHYDEVIKKIIYNTLEEAMKAYCEIQEEEMNTHKWIESEKAHTDLGAKKLKEWICLYSGQFRNYWVRTHLFVPNISN